MSKNKLNPADLVIDTFTNNRPGGRMRITHKPTGLIVEGSGLSLSRLRRELLRKLSDLIDASSAQ